MSYGPESERITLLARSLAKTQFDWTWVTDALQPIADCTLRIALFAVHVRAGTCTSNLVRSFMRACMMMGRE